MPHQVVLVFHTQPNLVNLLVLQKFTTASKQACAASKVGGRARETTMAPLRRFKTAHLKLVAFNQLQTPGTGPEAPKYSKRLLHSAMLGHER